jgi:hypothetical protein
MKRYQIVVGNVGHVCETNNGFEAWREYRRAIGDSKAPHGRASGEPVTMFKDGDIRAEYFGRIEQATD